MVASGSFWHINEKARRPKANVVVKSLNCYIVESVWVKSPLQGLNRFGILLGALPRVVIGRAFSPDIMGSKRRVMEAYGSYAESGNNGKASAFAKATADRMADGMG